MIQTPKIIYDYKIRIEWGKKAQRSRRLNWALAMAAPITVALLGGMASNKIRIHEFKLPPWEALFERETPTPDSVLRLPVASMSVSVEDEELPGATPLSGPTPLFVPAPEALKLPLEPPTPFRPLAGEEDLHQGAVDEAPPMWMTVKVQRGDNLALIFERLGLSSADLDRIIGLGGDAAGLKRLNPDDNLRFLVRGATLEELVHQLDLGHTLHVRGQEGAFTAETVAEDLHTRIVHATGVISSSLFEAGQATGMTDANIMSLAEIFGYDIDLVLDIREGDQFTVVYEEIFKDGRKVKDGNILAAEFNNQGKRYRAVRYAAEDGNAGYYRPDGASVRRAFIRTPVEFTRITSRFSLQRRHPILNRIRAHRGVDYAAPSGTPVRATGNGTVTVAGRQGGYGHVVILDHPGGYSTVYGHLSRFAKGIKQGSAVRQSQVIGYVGQSGLATGPHLHYEFRVGGVHRDPLNVALPNAQPIAKDKLPRFEGATRSALAMLDRAAAIAVAKPPVTPEVGITPAALPTQPSPNVTAAVGR